MRRVSVHSPAPVPLDEVRMLIALRPGEPMSERLVRRTLRTLRRSGVAAEVEIWRRPVAGGVEAIVVLRPDVRVVAVGIEGETGVKVDRLEPLLEQRPGQPLREDRVLRGDYRLVEKLESEGYLDPSVRLAVDVDDAAGTARVTYRVEAGERTTVESVDVAGLPAGIARSE
ncbi:MAG TPA: POTRA domain-containing protein, partial [Thermoanaerobaculia bacterium]|nr:POTRA domain-containing protein [Thermoanaerobaculia bacterium]